MYMNTQATLEKMLQTKFYGMAKAYQASLQQKSNEQILKFLSVAKEIYSFRRAPTGFFRAALIDCQLIVVMATAIAIIPEKRKISMPMPIR